MCNVDKVRQALLELADVLDDEEGPVIIAWSVDRLAEELSTRLESKEWQA